MIFRPYKIVVFALAGFLVMACSDTKEKETEQKPGTVKPAFAGNIKTTKSTISNQEKEMTLTGKVISDPDKTINYVPLISGIIERTYFSLGDKVVKGQSLMDIRSTELSALHSEKISLGAEVKIAERELKTIREMFDDNMSSERELLEAESKLKQTQAAFNKIEQDMTVFGVNKGDGTFSIKAPMNGYIINKNASSGSPMSADGEPLFTIADLNTVWVVVNVYASQLLFVKEGMEAKITTLSYPDETFTGKITNISQVFDPEDKALKARIILPNKDMKLKSEMSVVVRLNDATQNGLVSVPSEAVIFDNNAYYVVVEEGDNHFVAKEIVIYDRNKNTTYITSGLSADENVVTKNQLLIYSELKGK